MVKVVKSPQRLIWTLAAIVSLFPIYGVVSTSAFTSQTAVSFATWKGSGPDKWASIWLIERYIAPGKKVHLLEMNNNLEQAIMFDVPDSLYKQSGQQTTFDSLRLAWEQGALTDGVIPSQKQRLTVAMVNQLLNDIELNTWRPDELEQSIVLEYAYRDLQNEFRRNQVPRACYSGLFDRLAESLSLSGLSALNDPESLRPPASCMANKETEKVVPLVKEITTETVADYVKDNKKVVFVDVREEPEFNEVRIPGARNIQIRNVNSAVIDRLSDADLVVSYCVKDFRGYEMALKLAKAGIKNSTIMNPYGINGWISAGLPTYSTKSSGIKGEEESIQMMNDCFRNSLLENCTTELALKSSALNAGQARRQL